MDKCDFRDGMCYGCGKSEEQGKLQCHFKEKPMKEPKIDANLELINPNEPKICHYCEEPTNNPTKDHIYPLSKIRKHFEKGEPLPDEVDLNNNKVWACGICNANKGNKDYNSFKALGIKQIRHLKKIFKARRIKKRKGGKRFRR